MRSRRTEDQMLRRFVGSGVTALSDYEIEVIVCTSTNDALDGDVWDMQGVDLTRYAANPVVLWDHDMAQVIGRASDLQVTPEKITAKVTFPNEGISPKADEIRKMVKANMISGVSGGIVPVQTKQLDPRDPRSGKRVTKSILLEFSICAVPADATSGVTARSQGGDTVDNTDIENMNGDAAAAAGAATTAAAATAASAGGKPGQRRLSGTAGKHNRKIVIIEKRGLYEVGYFAQLLVSLGWLVDDAKFEAAIESDASKVPSLLAGVLHDAGDAFLAMAAEEVAELLNSLDVEPALGGDLTEAERSYVLSGKTPAMRSFRHGLVAAKARAANPLSDETVRCLREAKATHEEGIASARSAIATHKRALGMLDDLIDAAGAPTDDDADPEGATSASADDDNAERARSAVAFQKKARARAA